MIQCFQFIESFHPSFHDVGLFAIILIRGVRGRDADPGTHQGLNRKISDDVIKKRKKGRGDLYNFVIISFMKNNKR